MEILSPSTALRDRHTKFKIYEQEGVKYFLLINEDNETVEIYTHAAEGYQPVIFNQNEPFDFDLEDGCTISITLNEIWS